MNLRNLKKILTARIEDFTTLGDCEHTAHGPMIFIDNNAPVLAVGHLDYVQFAKPKIKKQYKNTLIYDCPQLDDRLGVWVILDQLKKAGIKCDVLLTDSEESGQSTAQYFKPPKQYNWMMEFDRQGGGTAMYDYEDQTTRDLLREYDYKVDQGSFTDICELYHLKCKGFNFGVGYHLQHTPKCYANLSETFDSLRKVQSIYTDWKDEYLEHDETYQPPIGYRGYTSGTYRGFNTISQPVVRTYQARPKQGRIFRETVNKSVNKSKWQQVAEIDEVIDNEMARVEQQRIKDELDYEQEHAKHAQLDTIALDLYGQAFIYCNETQKNHVRRDYTDHNFK